MRRARGGTAELVLCFLCLLRDPDYDAPTMPLRIRITTAAIVEAANTATPQLKIALTGLRLPSIPARATASSWVRPYHRASESGRTHAPATHGELDAGATSTSARTCPRGGSRRTPQRRDPWEGGLWVKANTNTLGRCPQQCPGEPRAFHGRDGPGAENFWSPRRRTGSPGLDLPIRAIAPGE
jgi:hypothetical protein